MTHHVRSFWPSGRHHPLRWLASSSMGWVAFRNLPISKKKKKKMPWTAGTTKTTIQVQNMFTLAPSLGRHGFFGPPAP